MNETILPDKADSKKEKYWYWLAGVLILAFLCIACYMILLPKGIIYIFPNVIYPKSQSVSKNSGVAPDLPLTKLFIYSQKNFKTTDNINQVYDWYTKHGWKEVSRNQGIVLENSTSVDLPINCRLMKSSAIGIIQSGHYTEIEIWTSIVLFY